MYTAEELVWATQLAYCNFDGSSSKNRTVRDIFSILGEKELKEGKSEEEAGYSIYYSYSKKTEDEDNFESGFKKGDKVEHPRFGIGKIVDISSDGYVGEIDFEDFGRKSLMLNLANLTKVVDDE